MGHYVCWKCKVWPIIETGIYPSKKSIFYAWVYMPISNGINADVT